MTITTLNEIPRDRYMRPLVTPANGGKPVAYTRCTTFVGCLEDTFNLSRWQQRMVAKGLAESPDLMLQIASTDTEDKRALNGICEAAMERAKAHAAATIGTALHALTERMDRGEDVGVVPEAYVADLAAYETATAGLDAVFIEAFSVNDQYKVGGTADRVVDVGGKRMIADLKTGSIDWGMGKIAMQLAMYAHSLPYDHSTGERSTWGDIDLDTALIIHLPAGTGECTIVPVDIAEGWKGVELASQVRQWRSKKWAKVPFEPTPLLAIVPEADTGDLEERIATAKSGDELRAIWGDHQDVWNDDLTALAKARTALLDNKVAS